MKKVYTIISLFLISILFGQNTVELDSLYIEISKNDVSNTILEEFAKSIEQNVNYKNINKKEIIKHIELLRKKAQEHNNPEMEALSYKFLGNLLSRETKLDSSIFYYKKGIKSLKGNIYNNIAGALFQNIATNKYYLSEYDSVYYYMGKSYDILNKIKSYKELCLLTYNLAVINMKQNHYASVPANLDSLFKCNIQYKSIWFEAQGNFLLGIFYDEVGNQQQSEKYFLKSIDLFKKDKSNDYKTIIGLINAISSYGKSLIKKQDYKNAERYCREALEIRYENNIPDGIEVVSLLESLIKTLIKNGKLDEAKQKLKLAEKISKNLNYKNYNPFLLIDKVEILIIEDKLLEAEKILQDLKNVQLIKTDAKGSYLMDLSLILNKYFLKKNNYKKAYTYLEKYHQIKDSIFNMKLLNNLNYTKEKFETQQKEAQILKLSNENLKKEAELNKTKNMVYLSSSISLAFLATGFFLWYKRHQKEKLLQLEAAVKATEHEKIRIGKELHDGIAGSLIRLVHEVEGSNVKLSDKLLKTYNEVRNLSHQLNNTPMHGEAFIDRLVELIPETKKQQQFYLRVLPSDLTLKEPYGTHFFRIVQELITNSLKHAGATKTIIEIKFTGDFLTLFYSDDGIGFKEIKKGSGLKNIEDRVALMKGKIRYKSEKGFEINIEIKL